MNRGFFVGVLALLISLLVFSWNEHRAAQTTKRQLAVVAADHPELENRQSEAEAELRVAQQKLAALEAAIVSRASLPPTPKRVPEPADFITRVNDDPQLQILQQKARRATLSATYGPLFRQLHLAPEKIEAFKDLLLRHNQDSADLFSSLRMQGILPTEPAMTKLYQQLNIDYENAQRDLVGDEGLKEWRDYDRIVPVREMISGIAGAAVVAGVILPEDTCEKLVRLIAANSPDFVSGKRVDLSGVDWEMVDAQAQVILSPEQFTTFSTIEPPGPTAGGARWLPRLNKAITDAANAEKSHPTTSVGG